jgi:tetratricopeptide (TPR) repeat protein
MNKSIQKSVFSLSLCLIGFAQIQAQSLKDAVKMTESERYEAASATFKKVVKSGDDQSGDVWFYYGANFLKWGVLDSAKVMFQKGIDSKPSNPLSFAGLGSVAWKENNADAAKQNFYKATSLTTTQTKELPKDKQVKVYLTIAEAYMQGPVKNLADALTNINAAMKLDPKNPDVYIMLGDYSKLKNVTDASEAIKNYEKAGDLDKTSTKALLRQGQVWVDVQDYEDGLKSYNQAIKIDSMFAPVYHARADLYLRAGKYKQAIADYRKYLAMNDSRAARENYARALFDSKDYKTTISEINDIQKKDSSFIAFYRFLGYSYYETNDYAPGLQNMEKFLKKEKVTGSPKLIADDFAYYGKLLSKSGNDSLGLEQVKKAVLMDTSKIDYMGDIAGIYYKMKRFGDAANYYVMKIKRSRKVNVRDYTSLGQAYYQSKDFKKADSIFALTTESYPVYGNSWRAKCNDNMEKDRDKPEGKAKPFYELVIKNSGTNIDVNKKDLILAYSYLAPYYLIQKNYDCAKAALLKWMELDPTSEKAKLGLEDKNIKAASGTCELVK